MVPYAKLKPKALLVRGEFLQISEQNRKAQAGMVPHAKLKPKALSEGKFFLIPPNLEENRMLILSCIQLLKKHSAEPYW